MALPFDKMYQRSLPYLPLIKKIAAEEGVPESLLFGMGAIESAFNPKATGPDTGKGRGRAKGAYQFLDSTAKQYGITDPYDFEQSARGAAKFYKDNLKTLGDPELALMAHNAGAGNIKGRKGPLPGENTKFYNTAKAYQNYYDQLVSGQKGPTPPEEIVPIMLDENNNPLPTQNQPLQGFSQQAPSTTQQQQQPFDYSQFLPQPQKKSGLDTLITALAAIGQLGGTAANIIGAVKGRPGAGNAALQSGSSLLQSISNSRQQNADMLRLAPLFADPNVPDYIKRSALISQDPKFIGNLIAQQGISQEETKAKEATKLADFERDNLEWNRRQEVIAGIKSAQDDQDFAQQMQIAGVKDQQKQDQQQALFNEYTQLSQLDTLTQEQKARKSILAGQLNIDEKNYWGDIHKQFGDQLRAMQKLTTLRNMVPSLAEAVNSGRIKSTYEGVKNYILPNGDYTEFNATLNDMKVRIAKLVDTSGRLSDKDPDILGKLAGNTKLTPGELERLHTILDVFVEDELKTILGASKDLAGGIDVGQKLLKTYQLDEFSSKLYPVKEDQQPAPSNDTKVQLQPIKDPYLNKVKDKYKIEVY